MYLDAHLGLRGCSLVWMWIQQREGEGRQRRGCDLAAARRTRGCRCRPRRSWRCPWGKTPGAEEQHYFLNLWMLLVITFSFRCFEYETGLSGIFSNQIWPEWRSFLSKNIFAQYCTHWASPNIELVAYLWYIRSSWLGDVVPIDADEVGVRLEVHDPVLAQPHLGFKDDYHSKISKMIIFQRWWEWKWHGEESSNI